MKNEIRFNVVVILLLFSGFFLAQPIKSQVVNEATKKRVTIGVGMFEDIWSNVPSGIKTRDINQGFQTFVMYNVPFGKSNFGFSIGLGLRVHNLYGNFLVMSSNDSTYFQKIPDTIGYRRSKLTMPFLEIPIEFKFKSKSKIALGIGFKVGYLLPAHSKYVGENYIDDSHEKLRVKYREIKNLENFSYGPTLRFGYRWFHITGYYSISKLFTKSRGPDMYPISVGFLLMPF